MARLTMEELERLAVGQGSDTGTCRYQNGTDTSQHLVWMQPNIYARIHDVCERAGQPLTRLQIARALGLSKTPWLVSAIERLANEGYLTRLEGRTPQGVVVWLYEVTNR